jgi:hypothetical protein
VWTNSPGFEARHLHHGQQRIAGDVERHAEEDVGAALVELAGELAVGDVELEEAWQGGSAILSSSPVPGRDDDAARIRIVLDVIHHVWIWSMTSPVGRRPGAPLLAVDRPEIAVARRPTRPRC